MNALLPSPAQIRAQAEAVVRKRPGEHWIAIHAPGAVEMEPRLDIEGEGFTVSRCDSVLELRALLSDAPAGLVILTALEERELGSDLRARLAGRCIYRIDPWLLVKEKFKARWIDSRLSERHPWVTSVLIEAEPQAGWPPAPNSTVDAERVWGLLFEHLLGVPGGRRDPETLLEWSWAEDPPSRLAALSEDARQGLRLAVGESTGEFALAVFEAAYTLGRRAVAVGLVARVLFAEAHEGTVDAARGRGKLEALLGRSDLSADLGRRWAEAAEAVVRRRLAIADDPIAAVRPVLEEADTLVRELGVESLVGESRVLQMALERRLERLAAELQAFAGSPSATLPPQIAEAARAAMDHALVIHDPTRQFGIAMAVRLAGWLATRQAAGAAGSFVEAARAFRADSGYADWARTRVWADGDSFGPLKRAYAALAQAADGVREAENRRFAELLAEWTRLGASDPAILPVEEVLRRVAEPVARAQPLLVVVVDGMSFPVFRELAQDLGRRGWVELGPDSEAGALTGLAVLPTVTEASRTSLLCGERRIGTQADESRSFAAYEPLRAVSEPAKPPRLFHKAGLRDESAAGLSPDVVEAVEDERQRVVGVVINAVDDHLAKGDQIRVAWTVQQIRPLDELLEYARASGRAVLLTSDHGHVLERQTELRAQAEAERWRAAESEPGEGEIRLEGPRVLLGGGTLIAPWSERIRYSTKKNGYHGGATPQEALVPVALFASGEGAVDALAGWRELPPETPAWWDWQTAPEPRAEVAPPPRRAPAPGGQGQLFPTPGGEERRKVPAALAGQTAPAWVDALLESSVFRERQARSARTALPQERVRAVLVALDARGGKLTRSALARAAGIPSARLPGVLSALRRLLNVDGYDVLAVDEASETIELRRDLLGVQFELELGS